MTQNDAKPITAPPQALAPGPPEPDVAPLIAAFLAGRSEPTLRAYRQDLEQFRAFTGDATLEEAVSRLLESGHGNANAWTLAFRSAMGERGVAPATINRRLAALRSLVKLARMLGRIPWALDVENVRHETYRDTRGPGRAAVQRLIASAAGDATSPRAVRDHALLRLLFDLGLRRGEVVALDLADLDLERSAVSVRGKGRSQKTLLTLPEPTKAALSPWLSVRGAAPGPLFVNFDRTNKGGGRLSATSLYRIIRGAGEEQGITVRPHGLRHAAITEACKAAQAAGIGLEEVLDFSRHKSVAVLMIYRDRERNVQGAIAALVAASPDSPEE